MYCWIKQGLRDHALELSRFARHCDFPVRVCRP
jgi:hypothetical protein